MSSKGKAPVTLAYSPRYHAPSHRLIPTLPTLNTTSSPSQKHWLKTSYRKRPITGTGTSSRPNSPRNTPSKPAYTRPEQSTRNKKTNLSLGHDNKVLFYIHFDDLLLHFYRRHLGDGTGLDVSADSFVVSQPSLVYVESAPDSQKSKALTALYLNLDEIRAENILIGPKFLPQFAKNQVYDESAVSLDTTVNDHSTLLSGSSPSSAHRDSKHAYSSKSYRRRRSVGKSYKHMTEDLAAGVIDWQHILRKKKTKPHIEYHQQTVGNLRRCIIDICDTVGIIQWETIMSIVTYFVDPIELNNHRNLASRARSDMGLIDICANLDVELRVCDTTFGLPRVADGEEMSVMCIESDFTYTHSWRGFLLAGPGCRMNDIDVSLKSTFIAPICDLRVVGAESLIDPCRISLLIDLHVLSEGRNLTDKMNILSRSVTLGKWCNRTSKLSDHAMGVRNISMNLSPLNHPINLAQTHRSGGLKRESSALSLPNDPSLSDPTSHTGTDPSHTGTGTTASGTTAPGTGAAETQWVQIRFSLQDFNFVNDAVRQLVAAIDTITPTLQIHDKYKLQFYSFYDIQYLTPATYYFPYTHFDNHWELTDHEILAASHPVQVLLKNNTYNIKIAKAELSSFQMTYSITQRDQLNVASGGSCSIWSYNENAYTWEPLFESANVSLIAATDVSKAYVGSSSPDITPIKIGGATKSLSTSCLVRYDIYCSPIDFNLSQTTIIDLIRKISLTDVVTTSSIHLPPYRIINDLGIDVSCRIWIGDDADNVGIDRHIPKDSSIPVDRQQISQVMRYSLKHKRHSISTKYNTPSHLASSNDRQHRLDINFAIGNDIYTSKKSILMG